jgi:peroxiredoxin
MRPGDPVPDLTFRTADGQPVRLATFLTSDHLLLLFLRHLT